MFSFFKKSPPSTVSYSDLAVDMHSHLMPGIDDGSTDVDNSLELIKGLEDLGFKKFIATPHIFKDLYPNTDETIDGAHALLTAHLKQVHTSTVISAAAEYYMDDYFSGLLESGPNCERSVEVWFGGVPLFAQCQVIINNSYSNCNLKDINPYWPIPNGIHIWVHKKSL